MERARATKRQTERERERESKKGSKQARIQIELFFNASLFDSRGTFFFLDLNNNKQADLTDPSSFDEPLEGAPPSSTPRALSS